MATKSRNIKDGSSKNDRDQIHSILLVEAIRSLTHLKTGRTLSLVQIESRHRSNRLSSEQQLSKALRPLKGFLKGDKREWPYR